MLQKIEKLLVYVLFFRHVKGKEPPPPTILVTKGKSKIVGK